MKIVFVASIIFFLKKRPIFDELYSQNKMVSIGNGDLGPQILQCNVGPTTFEIQQPNIYYLINIRFYLVNSKGQRPIFAVQLGLPSAHQQFERVSTFSAQ